MSSVYRDNRGNAVLDRGFHGRIWTTAQALDRDHRWLVGDTTSSGLGLPTSPQARSSRSAPLESPLRYIGSCDRIIALVGDAYGFEPEETARPDRTAAPFLYPVGVLVRH